MEAKRASVVWATLCPHHRTNSYLAAGNSNGLPGDGYGMGTTQPQHGFCDLYRLDQAALGIVLDQFGQCLFPFHAGVLNNRVQRAADHVRVCETRANCVNRHALSRQFQRQRPRQTQNTVLGSTIS